MNFFSKLFSKGGSNSSLDFKTVDSKEKAFELYKKGELVRIYLFPIEYGGQEEEINAVYVPSFVEDLKTRFDNMVGRLLEQGQVNNYTASPKYKGKSHVPSKLVLTTTGTGSINETIEIW